MNTEQIGNFLQRLRKEKGLMQKDVAKLCNVSVQAVSKWERGGNMPDIETLERLSILYDVSINELINGEKQEVYLDVEKRKNIVGLIVSALLFLVYLFPYIRGAMEIDAGIGDVYYGFTANGYELIFNAVATFMLPIWTVFALLISQLIVRIFTLTKIIHYTPGVKRFILASSSLIIIVCVSLLIHDAFYAFPQVVFAGAMLVNVHLHYEKGDFLRLRQGVKLRKKEPNKASPNTEDRNPFTLAMAVVSYIVGVLYAGFFVLTSIAFLVGEPVSAGELLLSLIAGFIPGIFILLIARNVKGEAAKAFLLPIGVMAMAFPVFMSLDWAPNTNTEAAVITTIYLTPFVFFLGSYFLHKHEQPSSV